ncbi:MAG: hypothetical protein B7Z19_01745, partial [Polynucleobacter sp. 32-46-5]
SGVDNSLGSNNTPHAVGTTDPDYSNALHSAVGGPHFRARGNIETIQMHDGSHLDVPGVIPKLSRTPGSIRTLAPNIGENTDDILRGIGLTSAQIDSLKERGIAFTK